MSHFDESKIRRDADGQFASKGPAAEDTGITLTQPQDPRWEGSVSERAEALRDLYDETMLEYGENGFEAQAARHLRGLTESDVREMRDHYFTNAQIAEESGDPDRATELYEQVIEIDDREAQWKNHPTWREPQLVVTEKDDYYGPRISGQKYDPKMSSADRNKEIRADIKEAVAAGYLPSEYTYSVRQSPGGSVDIDIRGMKDDDSFTLRPGFKPGEYGSVVPSWHRSTVENRVGLIGRQYIWSKSNPMVDYSAGDHVFTRAETESSALWRKHEAETKKAAAAAKAIPLGPQRDQAQQELREMRDRHAAEMTHHREMSRQKWGW